MGEREDMRLWTKSLPIQVVHGGDLYIHTGKTGRDRATQQRAAEYQIMPKRLWIREDGTITPD